MAKDPLISCLCLSWNRPALLKKAVQYFRAQTYPNKELIIIGHKDDEASRMVAGEGSEGNIRFYAVERASVGLLRNTAIEKSSGEYFCLWDDDDWHHERRLEVQMSQLRNCGKDACALAYCLLYDKTHEQGYLSFPSVWHPTLLCKKDYFDFGIQYDDVEANEGMNFLMKLQTLNLVCPVVMPHLYIHVFNGNNVRNAGYFKSLFSQSQRLSDHASHLIWDVLYGGHAQQVVSEKLSDEQMLGEFNYFYNTGRQDDETEEYDDLLQRLDARTVLNGPFKGLKYPCLESIGSSIIPKLTGSYENELAPVINEILQLPYTDILNIGCGEGYYANGLALACSHANVYAYDTDDRARKICREMAVLNEVSNRVHIKSFCSGEMIRHFRFSGRGLILCDCEGYEYELFTENTVDNLQNCDLLIETHDFVNIEITSKLEKLFRDTHHLTVVKSIDDLQKAKTYSFYPFEDITDLNKRKYLYAEKRPAIMEWFWLKSRHVQN